jgi:DNA helicase-2/ATP-dependent DNA helicase PcrA
MDKFGMAYLKMCLEGIKPKSTIKHLPVDEMQDYTPVHYAIVSKLFNCKITLPGDVIQSLVH